MADFKTTLEKLSRREIEFDAVAQNLDKLLSKRPQAAVTIMDQLKQAVTEDVIDAETYARLKKRVAAHVEAAPVTSDGDLHTRFDSGNDGTQFTGTPDRTQFIGTGDGLEGLGDATQLIGRVTDDSDVFDITGEGTVAPQSGSSITGIDFDLTGGSPSSLPSSWPGSGPQTGTDWPQPRESVTATRVEIGSLMRGRFKLEKVLGQGGMGSVFLASDQIKVRAKDKQPLVALKVLNEDFKQHPDSFIALQREASRQQKLAHPNIATVYDFDQTEDGLAFLVMELLEGEALNDFIKKTVKPKGGLPFTEAFPMVAGLGAALVYAHERNIVHSDFKPGNCFLTKAGQMKVLDFGIARAVKNPGAAEGEATIFDPGKLGALTPAYASVEMLEGEEPDTRDDIYALACVAYELLTGKHPFNKIPANKARDSGLKPEPIKTLTRRQWRGLERGLAYLRADRSQSTQEFLHEFEGVTSPWKNPLIVGPIAAAVLLLAGFAPGQNYLEDRDTSARIALAQTGEPANIEAVLSGMVDDGLDQSRQDRILNDAKEKILAYFDQSARAHIDIDNGKYGFNAARLVLEKAKAYPVYVDSSKLKDLEAYIERSEEIVLAEQYDKFNTALADGSLLAVDGEDDIHDAMAVVAQIDPGHPMLKDRRLAGAFATAVNAAIENEDYDFGEELTSEGLRLVTGDANAEKFLGNLNDKVAGAKDRAETGKRILEAIAAIQGALDQKSSLAGYVDIQDKVVDLAGLDPANELLEKLRADVEPRVTRELAALETSRNWGESELMYGNFNHMLRALGLHDLGAKAGALNDEFTAEVSKRQAEVTTAVAADKLAPEATGLVATLAGIAPRSERTADARDQLAKAFLVRAALARDKGDFAASAAALASAAGITPRDGVKQLLDAESALAKTEQGLDDAARSAARTARQAEFDQRYPAFSASIGGLGSDPTAFAGAFATLADLRRLSPADDRLAEGTMALAAAVASAGDALGQAGKWDEAVQLARAGIVDLPRASTLADKLVALEEQRKLAQIEADKQLVATAKSDIDKLLDNATADRAWRASVRQKMADIAALGDPADPWLKETGLKLATRYIERAQEMRADQRFAEGANLIADAERYGPDAPGLADEKTALAAANEAFEKVQEEQARLARIDGLRQTFETQAKASDVANAAKTLEALKREVGAVDDGFVSTEAPRLLAGAYLRLATTKAAETDFASALRFAKACAELQPQRQECKLAVRDYTVDGNKQDLQKTFSRASEYDLAEVLAKISEVQVLDPGEFSAAEGQWAQAVSSRIAALKEAAGTGANDTIERAKEVFAGNQIIAAIEPVKLTVAKSRYAADVNAAMDKALLSEARELLVKASEDEPNHPDIVRLKGAYNARVNDAKGLYEAYKKQYTGKDYAAARETMESALKVWSDSSTFKKEYARVVAKLSDTMRSDSGEAERILAPALPPTDPCEGKLAGHGKRKKGTCFYFVSGNQRGPLMVVVPAGGAFSKPFAIGKFEITVSDYNRYCRLSGKCQAVTGQEAALPVTGISLEQAQAYLGWLSERTGQKYRLPSAEEWTYAATAAGDQPKKDYNCRVEQGGQLLKGQGTMGVNTGKANGWGLYNYVGNVQEWVSNGSGVVARGGAFEDTFSKCDISLEKPHDGSADTATGFRVLLELG